VEPSKISVKIDIRRETLPLWFTGSRRKYGYIFAAISVSLCVLLSRHMQLYFQLPNIVMVYLAVVALIAFLAGRGPAIVASIMAASAFDFFNVPPHFLLTHSDSQYLLTLAIMLSISFLISGLTSQLRDLVEESHQREKETAALYAFSRELAATRGADMLGETITRHIEATFGVAVQLLLPRGKRQLEAVSGQLHGWDEQQAQQVWQQQTLDGSTVSCRPLEGTSGWVGLLMLPPDLPARLKAEERDRLLRTMLSAAALAVERTQYVDAVQAERVKVETERLRNSLLSAVSHDLRTPLATIVGASSSLQEDKARLDDAAITSLHKVIFQSSQRMRSLVENILDMARLQSGPVQLRQEWQAFEEVLGASLQEIKTMAGNRQIISTVPSDLPLLRFDSVLIQRVLINLLENAVKYTPDNGAIYIEARTEGDQVSIKVSDNGVGIPAEERDKIFEKFYRGSSSGSTQGAGLGLSISRTIIEAHQGKISASESAYGGLAIEFSLPWSPIPSAKEHVKELLP
jgi:two-component system sensor histidine kinase KdpD